jgi:hypothetical protein
MIEFHDDRVKKHLLFSAAVFSFDIQAYTAVNVDKVTVDS